MQKLAFIRRRTGESYDHESGQTMIFVVVGLAVVLLAIVGFAVDYGNIWFKRQHLQSAADAACTAAAMDMLNDAASGINTAGGFTNGVDFDCTAGLAKTPCQYATLNGYDSSGLTNNAESNLVQVTFSNTLNGNPIPFCDKTHPEITVCIPADPSVFGVSSLFVKVKITNRIKATFFGLLTPNNTVDVPAQASCGLVLATSPIPLLILDKTRASTLTTVGGGSISIYGGPVRSIQVNSTNTASLNFNGNKLQVDLSKGGPKIPPTGSNFGTTSINTTVPTTTNTAACVAPPSGPDICLGTTGKYTPNTRPIPDPFATIEAPDAPTSGTNINPATLLENSGVNGCPAPAGQKCTVYMPGKYTSDISISGSGANPAYIQFVNGIYYLQGGLSFGPNSCIRPSGRTGDGSKGTFFYFAGTKSISVDANSGCNGGSSGNKAPAPSFDAINGLGAGTSFAFGARCDSSSAALPKNLQDNPNITGSVLLAPCVAPTDVTLCDVNCNKNGGFGYGDPFGTSDPDGTARGLLMMQNRGVAYSNSNMPNWQGGGAFLLSGSLYFHQCGTSGTDTPGLDCPASAYTTQLVFGGNASGTSYVLGDIVTDQLEINGSSGVAMDLSPAKSFFTFSASLLQ
jgi:hypothetical protein